MLTVRLYQTNFLESTIVRYDDGRNPAQLANICILPPSPHTIYISKFANTVNGVIYRVRETISIDHLLLCLMYSRTVCSLYLSLHQWFKIIRTQNGLNRFDCMDTLLSVGLSIYLIWPKKRHFLNLVRDMGNLCIINSPLGKLEGT